MKDDATTTFATGSKRSSLDEVRFDLVSPVGYRRLAARCAMGAKNYGEHNWRKGQPYSAVINHLENHLAQYKAGDRSEDHLAAIAWGAFAMMEFEQTHPELDDLFRIVPG